MILALGWYLAIFLMMDVVWEVTLVLPVLALVWPTLRNTWERWGLGVLIGVYAALDIWQIISYLVWGDAILWQGSSYILTDPAIYVPIILLVLAGNLCIPSSAAFFATVATQARDFSEDRNRPKSPVCLKRKAMVSLNEFLDLPMEEVARLVRAAGAQVCVFPINGTRRWYLLESDGGDDYLKRTADRHIEVYRMVFAHGIHTLLAPVFGADLIEARAGIYESWRLKDWPGWQPIQLSWISIRNME